jgi:hypothetical protein
LLTECRTWYALINALINKLAPQAPTNGLQTIIQNWHKPGDAQKLPWPKDFSRDISPVTCHSHNDYWRTIPLFDALYAGCIGVEADIWFHKDSGDLQVGHDSRSLSADRTLKSLYIDPLIYILENQNQYQPASDKAIGVFEASPNATVVLLLDFKNSPNDLWPLVQTHLDPLRSRGWLTRWNSTTNSRTLGPITVVTTGLAPASFAANSSLQDVFFDAPLDGLKELNNKTAKNAYYASVSMGQAIGKVSHELNSQQLAVIDQQIKQAQDLGLVSRYWDTPSWPVSKRDRIWETLVEHGVGILNVDSLETATRWDWRWCNVAGLTLCR